MGTERFTEKLNKRPDGISYSIEEKLILVYGKFEGLLAHDNIVNGSVRVYTEPNFTGSEITSYVLSTPSNTPWRRNIRVYADKQEVYVTYQTPGDQVDADDINYIQDAIIETEEILSRTLLQKTDKDTTYTKTETDSRIQRVIGAAPEALDTLAELAEALNNDPNFAATITLQLSSKVDKVVGKSLSAEDYTTAEKSKLASIAAGANHYIHPSTHPPSIIVQDEGNRFVTDGDKASWNAKETTEGSQAKATAVQASLNSHAIDSIKHITSAERTAWNEKETITGSQMKVDFHANRIDNPHGVTKSQVGLSSVNNYDISTQAEAENGTSNVKYMTPLRTVQAIQKQISGMGGGDMLKSVYDTNNNGKVDRAEASDSVAWSGVSGKPTIFAPDAHDHTRVQKIDSRARKPVDTAKGFAEFVFTSLDGMTGTNGSNYQDMIVLNMYTDTSGGLVNALVFDKKTMTIRHYQAAQGSTTWGTPKIIAYQDDVLPKGGVTWGQLRG